MSPSVKCQTVEFYRDWHVISIFKVFKELDSDKEISKEELLRKTSMNRDALDKAILKINNRIKNCIKFRPEYDNMTMGQKLDFIAEEWLNAELEFFLYGKFRIGGRMLLAFRLRDNVEIAHLTDDTLVLRVYQNEKIKSFA